MVPEGVAEGVPRGDMVGVPDGVAAGVPDGVAAGVAEGIATGVPEGVAVVCPETSDGDADGEPSISVGCKVGDGRDVATGWLDGVEPI